MRAIVGLCLAVVLLGCAPVVEQSRSVTPVGTGEAITVGLGDQVIRVDRTENLPNLFGRADMFGRTRPRGFTELKYFGIDARGNPRFMRRDVEMVSTQTSVSESGLMFGSRTTQRMPDGGTGITSISMQPQPGRVDVLSPEILQITLDLTDSNFLTVHGHVVEVLEAGRTLLRFRVHAPPGGRPVEGDIRPGPGQFGSGSSERGLPQNAPRDWNGMPAVRPPP